MDFSDWRVAQVSVVYTSAQVLPRDIILKSRLYIEHVEPKQITQILEIIKMVGAVRAGLAWKRPAPLTPHVY